MNNLWLPLLLGPLLLVGQTVHPPVQSATGRKQPPIRQQKDLPAEVRTNLQQQIKHLLVSQVEAWNHGDLEGFMQGYWNSPELTFFSRTTATRGWEPALARYKQRYQGQGKEMGKLAFQALDIDLLSRRSAVVTGKWQLTMKDGKTPHGLFTLIFKRLPEGWRIVHDHTSGG